jgi:hypothetical protein
MSESQALVKPYWVQFHTYDEENGTSKAYPFLVVHEGTSESGGNQKWGWVFANDTEPNVAGLSDGENWRGDIGQGGPGKNVSWSVFE